MKSPERRQRITLTLLFSLMVFLIIAAAAGLSIGLLFLALHLGIITSIDGTIQVGETLLFMSLISTLLGLLLAILTSKLTLKPINRIINQLNRLSEGDFQVRIHFGKPIGSLAAFQQIEQSFNKAADELSHTETLRGDFINNFSHEFKTPIVSIAGFAKLLKHKHLTEEQRMEYLTVIEEESLRLSAMATNMLQLTKIENQTILTDVAQFNVSEQLRTAVLLLEEKWSKKALIPELEFHEHHLCGNEELLMQVWINLIDNAIKFSPNDAPLTVRLSADKEYLTAEVENEGPSIPESSIPYLFRKFYQADESHAEKGHGIGLAIVKKIVDLHDGDIDVYSRDGITRFSVRLPLKQNRK